MTDSQGDSLRLSSRPMMRRSMGAPRRRCAAASTSSSMVQWPSRECRITHQYQIEYAEVACSSEHGLGRRCQPDVGHQLGRCARGVAAHEQARSVRARVALTESDEDRVWNRLRQPPASKLSGGEVREGRTRGKHQTPGSELIGQAAGFLIRT